jgi:cathepsin D
VLTYRT